MHKEMSINVEYLTRVEGHGNIVVNFREGRLEECRLDIIESPRFFEGMLRGRPVFEAPHISSRICGICSCGHTLASIQAAEDALGITPTEQTIKLRRLMLNYEILDSHILHIYILAVPDLAGAKSVIPMIETHNKAVRRALRMKKVVNNACDILTGRHVHPITAIIGGFTKLPGKSDLIAMHNLLTGLRGDTESTLELVSTFRFPAFERETEYVSLVSDGPEYPLLSGDLGSSEGVRMNKRDYRSMTNEFIVPHSSAKHTKLSRDAYAVGALSRFNMNYDRLHPHARKTAERLGIKPRCANPYLNTVAQLVEWVHCLEESIVIIEELMKSGVDYSQELVVGVNEHKKIPVKKGSGVGAVEVPRGTLYHNYEIDENGIIVDANCIIPTNQNLHNIEHDMEKLVPEIMDKSQDEITLALEMLVRAYDPCISCSTHILKVSFVNS
jgi:coenzyme F420-reducing hydrogenase alpha subunit